MSRKSAGTDEKSQAQAILRGLGPHTSESQIVCPLCGSTAPARGLQVRPADNGALLSWQILFICPSCGLMSRFHADESSLRQAVELRGSSWIAELRSVQWNPEAEEEVAYEVPGNRSHQIAAFVVSFLTWMALIGNFNPVEVLWGVVVSLAVALYSHRFTAAPLPKWIFVPRRWLAFFALAWEFTRQLIVQNVTLSLRVFHPKLPIRPGIVAIPTRLTGDVDLTILGSLMTLTPDTVTMDLDAEQGLIYVHWIDVQSMDPQKAQELVSQSLEEKIIHWIR